MLPQEMPRLVRDYAGQLRLVAHSQQQARKDHREAGREHHRIEFGNAGEVDPHVLRRRPADPTDQAAQIVVQPVVLDQ